MADNRKFETHILPNIEQIEKWLMQGATARDIAKKLHISGETLRNYRRKGERGEKPYDVLSATFTKACKVPDDEVENALWKRACGIWYDEQTFETKWSEPDQAFVERCTKRVRKYIPPDPTSATFWLTNRRPDKWKYRREVVDEDGKNDGGIIEMGKAVEEPSPPPELVAAARLEDANG